MKACVGADERAKRKLNGIIADLLVDFTSVAASAPEALDAASSLLGLVRTLSDAKTLACDDAFMFFSAAHSNDRDTFPFEKRAAKVPEQYLAVARDLYQKFQNLQRGEVGRLKPSNSSSGQGMDPGLTLLLVSFLGAFGELSNSC
jgi:hypothetical protein